MHYKRMCGKYFLLMIFMLTYIKRTDGLVTEFVLTLRPTGSDSSYCRGTFTIELATNINNQPIYVNYNRSRIIFANPGGYWYMGHTDNISSLSMQEGNYSKHIWYHIGYNSTSPDIMDSYWVDFYLQVTYADVVMELVGVHMYLTGVDKHNCSGYYIKLCAPQDNGLFYNPIQDRIMGRGDSGEWMIAQTRQIRDTFSEQYALNASEVLYISENGWQPLLRTNWSQFVLNPIYLPRKAFY